jgi:hypothetical protein
MEWSDQLRSAVNAMREERIAYRERNQMEPGEDSDEYLLLLAVNEYVSEMRREYRADAARREQQHAG